MQTKILDFTAGKTLNPSEEELTRQKEIEEKQNAKHKN